MSSHIFDAVDVRRVVEHSITAKAQGGKTIGYDSKTGEAFTEPVDAPAVMLVHDEGVYLMSNGQPRDVSGERSFVAYARGCHPFRDPIGASVHASLLGAVILVWYCLGPTI